MRRAVNLVFSPPLGLLVGMLMKVARPVRVVVVVGMRRSGNHAVIGWLTNGLKGSGAALGYTAGGFIGSTSAGRVCHLNDLSVAPSARAHLRVIWHWRRLLRADYVIASFEDVAIDPKISRHPCAHAAQTHVVVRRSTINLVASRLKARESFRSAVAAERQMPLDERFVGALVSHIDGVPAGWTVVDFDEFIGSAAYRATLVDELELKIDLLPGITEHGGGSSFSGRGKVPLPEELTARAEMVSMSPAVCELLLNHADSLHLGTAEVALLTGRTRPPC